MFKQLRCTAEYRNTTVICFNEKFDDNIFYYVAVYHDYKNVKYSKLIRMTEFTDKEDALKAYTDLITVIHLI